MATNRQLAHLTVSPEPSSGPAHQSPRNRLNARQPTGVVVFGGKSLRDVRMRIVTLLAVSTVTLFPCAAAATPEITFALAHGSADEDKTRKDIQQLIREYDLSDWVWTRTVVIESGAIPHSHPKLTLGTRQYEDRLLSL